jgi:hypothetical protein
VVQLNVYQGDDYTAVVSVTDLDGQPIDLTGYTLSAEVRRDVADRSSTAPACTFTTTVSGNEVQLELAHAVTASLAEQLYVWDLQSIAPSGRYFTLVDGTLVVRKEVTRA